MDRVVVQVWFEEETEHGPFQSVVDYSWEDYSALTPKQLAADKAMMVASYVDRVNNQPIPEEPTPEQIQQDLDVLEDQKVHLEEKLTMAVAVQSARVSGNIIR